MSPPFDYVRWSRQGQPDVELNPAEFLAVPLTKRVRSLIAAELTFYLDGEELPPRVALDRLSKAPRLKR